MLLLKSMCERQTEPEVKRQYSLLLSLLEDSTMRKVVHDKHIGHSEVDRPTGFFQVAIDVPGFGEPVADGKRRIRTYS
jgi:hypothetical protein